MLQYGGSNVLDNETLLGHPLLQVTLSTVQHTTSNTVSLCSSQGISGSSGSILFTLDGELVGVCFSEIEPGDSGCYIANPLLRCLLAEMLQIARSSGATYTEANLGRAELSHRSTVHSCGFQLSKSQTHLGMVCTGQSIDTEDGPTVKR